MNLKIFAIITFIAMYVFMTMFLSKRIFIVWAVAILYLITGIVPLSSVIPAINWNVIMMIGGTMIVVDYFIDSKMPNRMADILLDKSKNVMWVTIYMSIFAGAVSAFIDNVATVLMIAPVGMAICKKLKINPVPMIISIAVSSNLQGAATLVGDTTSIMLGAYAHMDFTSFFWVEGRPGIFFSVELGVLATIPIMMFLFRKDTTPVQANERQRVNDYFPSVMLILVVVLLILASFIPNKPDTTNGMICLCLAGGCVVRDLIKNGRKNRVNVALASVDYETLLLLTGLFIVIDGITEVGLITDVADAIASFGGSNIFLLYTVIVWFSVFISAFIDNIPYVATMLPVVSGITEALGVEPYLLYFGLLTGATLGGNLTPIGASANITATGMLKKAGYEVTFKEFARIGVPFTLAAVTVGYLFTWAVWH